jgi:hypothetical protein
MKKHESLRAAILAANPALVTDPDQLAVFIDKGKLAARYGEKVSFEYRYRCVIIVTNFSGNPAQILFPALLWVRDNQAETLLNHDAGDQALTFDVVVLGEKLFDLEIQLDLTEAVDAVPQPGGYELVYRPEPPIDAAFAGMVAPPLLGEIWAHGELLCSRPGEPSEPGP